MINVRCLLCVEVILIFVAPAIASVFFSDQVLYLLGCFSDSVLMYLCNHKR